MKRYNFYETDPEEASDGDWVLYKHVASAIKAAVEAEREACALVAESEHVGEDVCDDCDNLDDECYNLALRHAAEAIRARGQS